MNQINAPILIIEDIPSVRDLLEVTLRYKGYQVITAANGVDALDIQGELALVTGAGVDHPNLVHGNHLSAAVLHQSNRCVFHL